MTEQFKGFVIGWDAPAEISLVKVRDALRKAGLDEGMMRDMNPLNAVKRALGDMKKGRVIRKLLKNDDGDYFFQLTAEVITDDSANYFKEAEVRLDMKTGLVHCDKPEIANQAQKLLNEHLQKRKKTDLSNMIKRLFEEKKGDLIAFRKEGGVYFVPEAHEDLVKKTGVLVTEIGGNLRQMAVSMGHSATDESIISSMIDHFDILIKEYEESCDKITDKSKQYVIDRRYEASAEIRQKIENYLGIMGVKANVVRRRLEKADERFEEKLRSLMKPEVLPI